MSSHFWNIVFSAPSFSFAGMAKVPWSKSEPTVTAFSNAYLHISSNVKQIPSLPDVRYHLIFHCSLLWAVGRVCWAAEGQNLCRLLCFIWGLLCNSAQAKGGYLTWKHPRLPVIFLEQNQFVRLTSGSLCCSAPDFVSAASTLLTRLLQADLHVLSMWFWSWQKMTGLGWTETCSHGLSSYHPFFGSKIWLPKCILMK